MIKGKRVLVTGGSGSIGGEIVRQLAPHNKVFILDISERAFVLSQTLKQEGYWVEARIGDIRDMATVVDLFEDFKPQYVFHAAALKHVSPHETYPLEAIMTNSVGTYNVLHQAKRYECLEKFVYISTDKVVNANSIMGITKKVGEVMVKNNGGICVRFGNVMDSDGSLIPIWQNQVNQGKPMTITDSRMQRFMMSIPQAVGLVLEAAERGKAGEIYILDMGKPINIKDLAVAIVERSGANIKLKEIGIRPGETLTEELMTLEEKQRAIKKDKFFIIK